MKIKEIIVEGYREAQHEFTVTGDNDAGTIAKLISIFKALVNKNQVTGDERNIDYWRKQGLPAFRDFVTAKQAISTKTQVKLKKVPGKCITLQDDANWLIIIPLDKNASCFYGKNSNWCTTKIDQSNFEHYFYQNDVALIYCINKQSNRMWAIAGHTDLDKVELFDQMDNPLTEQQFKQQTGIDSVKLLQQVLGAHSAPLAASRKDYKLVLQRLDSQLQQVTGRNPEIEKDLLFVKEHVKSNQYVTRLIQLGADLTELPMGIIRQAALHNPQLLREIPNVSEKVKLDVVKSNGMNLQYVTNPSAAVIDAALKDKGAAVEIINHQLSFEDVLKYPRVAVYYALDQGSRNREAEDTIATDAVAVHEYLPLRPGPWPEAEPALIAEAERNPDAIEYLADYAIKTKTRVKEGEHLIARVPRQAALYAIKVLRKPWREIEDVLLDIGPSDADGPEVMQYADRFEWPEYYEKYESEFDKEDLPEWYQQHKYDYYG